MPGICHTALAGIAELRKDYGIDPTPDEIVRLHEAGRRQEEPSPGERLALLGCPSVCGRAVLFRLTIAAEIWWRDLACTWWDGSNLWLTASLGYAMAHGRLVGHLEGLCSRDQAFSAVRAWFRGLNVSQRELDAAIEACLQDDEDDRLQELRDASQKIVELAGNRLTGLRQALAPILDAPAPARPKPTDWESLAHDLAAMTSAPPDYWLHQDRDSVLRAWVRATRHEMARAGMPGTLGIRDRQAEAIAAFRAEIVAIIAAHAAPIAPETPETAI